MGSEAETALTTGAEGRKFTLFPKLPIEIRLKIWHCMFAKRHIELDMRSCYLEDMGYHEDTESPVHDKPPKPYIPATLAVNRESREENLRKYHFISFPRSHFEHFTSAVRQQFDLDIKYGPGWVNPSVDSIFFPHPPAVMHDFFYVHWFSSMSFCIPDGLSNFRELEIRNAWLDDTMVDEADDPQGLLLPLFQLILHFHGLKTILLTGDNTPQYVPTDEHLEKLRKMVVDFLERHANEFIGDVAPVVRARQYQDLYTGERTFA
jgi:hypothetical protein